MSKAYHTKKSYSDTNSPTRRSLNSETSSDVYDHLYNVHKPIHILVYRNGDPFDPGVSIPVTRTQFKNWLNLLDYLTERLQLPEGAVHNVYDLYGEEIRHFKHLKQNGVYVAAKGEFREADYGGKDTHRKTWQIRHPSPKPDPSAVMSKESRQLYLESKGFKPVVDDIWDDATFDKKTAHTLITGNQKYSSEKSRSVYQANKDPKRHNNVNNNATKHNGQSYSKNGTKTVNKTEIKETAYRMSDKGKAAPTQTKSRFPPINSGNFVENKNVTKVDKNKSMTMRHRSNSAPTTPIKEKKRQVNQSSKSNFSEPKNVPTTNKSKQSNLKPPIKTNIKKSSNTNLATETSMLKPTSNRASRSRSKSPGRLESSRRESQRRNSYTKSRASLENEKSMYRSKSERRATSYDGDYAREASRQEYRDEYRDEEEEYYEDRDREPYRDGDNEYQEEGRRTDYGYREPTSYTNGDRRKSYKEYNDYDDEKRRDYDYRDYEEEEEEYEARDRKKTSKPATRYKRDDETDDKLTSYPLATSGAHRVTSPLKSQQEDDDDKSRPKWAVELTAAVRELASEVHHLKN